MVNALDNAASWGDVLVATHIRSIGDNGDSDTYATGNGFATSIVTPEPTSIVLLGSALMGFAFVGWRRRRVVGE